MGNYIYPLDDPLLWAPIVGMVGSLVGIVLLAGIEISGAWGTRQAQLSRG